MNKIRIAIADDYSIFRDGLKVALAADDHFQVVLEAANGEDLLKGLENTIVDVILMDITMPIMNGKEATKQVRKKFPSTKVLMVTMHGDDKYIIDLMENGANGYLLKNADADEIRKSIYCVCENNYYFNDRINMALLNKLLLKGNMKPSFNENIVFTEHELDVLKLICQEKTATEIGKEMFLSARTIEGIRTKLIEKIGVRNTVGLVMFALKNGIAS